MTTEDPAWLKLYLRSPTRRIWAFLTWGHQNQLRGLGPTSRLAPTLCVIGLNKVFDLYFCFHEVSHEAYVPTWDVFPCFQLTHSSAWVRGVMSLCFRRTTVSLFIGQKHEWENEDFIIFRKHELSGQSLSWEEIPFSPFGGDASKVYPSTCVMHKALHSRAITHGVWYPRVCHHALGMLHTWECDAPGMQYAEEYFPRECDAPGSGITATTLGVRCLGSANKLFNLLLSPVSIL